MAARSNSNKRKVWRFVHQEDEYLTTNVFGLNYESENGFLKISPDGKIHINGSCYNGYAWDGCTPKWEFLDFTMGTPDGRLDYLTLKPMTYYASMVHDILYQHKAEIPISRLTADKLFYKLLKESGFMWAGFYYAMVRIAGGLFDKWKVRTKVKDLRIIESSWIKKSYQEIKVNEFEGFESHPFIQKARTYKKQEPVSMSRESDPQFSQKPKDLG